MSRIGRMTIEEYIKRLEEKYFGNAELISDFNGLQSNVTIRFIDCGHKHSTKAVNFIYKANNGCNICNKNEKKTTEQFKNEVYSLVGEEYKILGEYIGNHKHVLIKHICGNEYLVAPSDFLSGKRCPECQHRSYKKTDEEFRKEIYDLVGDEYEVLEDYIDTHTKILFKHKNCGTVYPIKPSKFLAGNRCPNCMWEVISNKTRRTHEDFCSIVEDLVGNEYSVISDYTGAHKHLNMKHNICGSIYPVKANNFINGRRCPICCESHGEQEIRKILNKFDILNIAQKSFDGLLGIGNGLLSYDFYLSDYNLLIEYQGEQHEKYIPGLHESYEDFKRQVEHDKRKKYYAQIHNIKLLEIWYYNFDNIEEILKDELNINYKQYVSL